MRSLISFFTRIPAKGDVYRASQSLYLITVVAIIIALFPLILYIIIYRFIPRILLTIILLLSIYGVTGLLHLDGLADFSDGIMKKGTRDEKIRVLKDVNTGIGGTFSVIMILLIEFYAIYSLRINLIGVAAFFIVSEISAKLSMLTGLIIFKAPEQGLANEFKKSARGSYLIIAILLTIPLIIIFKITYFNIFAGIVISLIIGSLSNKNFGFVNGDALGAMNEISRAATMWLLCLGL
ncbi:MAG: adenosylcobinamide-GDP ribazoletransferase [Thermoplasmata archaeon]